MSRSPDWMELTRLWQAEGAAVSVDELEQHRQRERAAMRALAAVELAGLALGIVVGIWMSIASPFIWVSSVFIATGSFIVAVLIGVATAPGPTLTILIPCGPSSWPAVRVSIRTPPLDRQ